MLPLPDAAAVAHVHTYRGCGLHERANDLHFYMYEYVLLLPQVALEFCIGCYLGYTERDTNGDSRIRNFMVDFTEEELKNFPPVRGCICTIDHKHVDLLPRTVCCLRLKLPSESAGCAECARHPNYLRLDAQRPIHCLA